VCKRYSIYEKQVGSRFDASIHTGHMLKSVLKRISVFEVIRSQKLAEMLVINEATDLQRMLNLFFNHIHSSFPVVDGKGKLIAMVSERDLWSLAQESELGTIVIAADIARKPVTVTPQDNLFQVIQMMAYHKVDEVIVTEPSPSLKPIAVISRSNVVSAYQKELFGSLD
jgi:CIC family chloride channel protein